MTSLYAVMGNPIEHSLSPKLHTAFAKETHQDIVYEKILVEKGKLQVALNAFIARGGKGLSITAPLKEEAFQLVTHKDNSTLCSKAVNTIVIHDDKTTTGYNTDGIGLLRDLENHLKLNLSDKRILILGAGGAARAILPSLLSRNPSEIIIANRTGDKALLLAKEFNLSTVKGCDLISLENKPFDLIINCTSSSWQKVSLPLSPALISPNTCCYDLAYNLTPNVFLEWGKTNAASLVSDGFGMLKEQALEAFYLWRGIRVSLLDQALKDLQSGETTSSTLEEFKAQIDRE